MDFASSYQIINTTKIYSGFIFLSNYPLLRSFWFTYYLQLLTSVSKKQKKQKKNRKEAKIRRFILLCTVYLFSFDNLWLVMLCNSFYLTYLVNYTISIAWMTKERNSFWLCLYLYNTILRRCLLCFICFAHSLIPLAV